MMLEDKQREIMEISSELDVVPSKVRRYMMLRDSYVKSGKLTVVLNPTINSDAKILEVMGWGDDEGGAKVRGIEPVGPPRAPEFPEVLRR